MGYPVRGWEGGSARRAYSPWVEAVGEQLLLLGWKSGRSSYTWGPVCREWEDSPYTLHLIGPS
jgi:hypothetical protein